MILTLSALQVPELWEFEKRVEMRLTRLYSRLDTLSLYDQTLFAFALDRPEITFLAADLEALCHWGIILPGACFSTEVRPNRNVILSVRTLVALGNDKNGDDHVNSFNRTAFIINTPETLNKLNRISVPKLHVRHRFGRVRPRTWRFECFLDQTIIIF